MNRIGEALANAFMQRGVDQPSSYTMAADAMNDPEKLQSVSRSMGIEQNFDWSGSSEGWTERRQNRAAQGADAVARFTDIPSGADPNRDPRVGEDEYGRPTYRGPTGHVYAFQPAQPEQFDPQRGDPLAKRVYDAIPPLENWRFPTREEVGTAARVVGDMVYEIVDTPASAARGEPVTTAQALDVGGLAFTGALGARAAGLTPTDPNTLGIFVGSRAIERNPDLRRTYEDFQTMDATGGWSDQEMFMRTGWFRSADGTPRTEISDYNYRINHYNLASLLESNPRTRSGETTLGNVVEHPEFFRLFPELEDYNVRVQYASNVRQGYGWHSHAEREIGVVANNPQDLQRIMLHEMNHAAQHVTGIDRGSSAGRVAGVFKKLNEAFKSLPEDAQRYQQVYRNMRSMEGKVAETQIKINRAESLDSGLDLNRLEPQLRNQKKQLEVLRQAVSKQRDTLDYDNDAVSLLEELTEFSYRTDKDSVYNIYRRNQGETESRATENRMHLNEYQRLLRHPKKDFEWEDVDIWTHPMLDEAERVLRNSFQIDDPLYKYMYEDVGGLAFTDGLGAAATGMIPEGALGVNVPYYRGRSAPRQADTNSNQPINWDEFGLTPPNDPAWSNITRKDLENYYHGDELPGEWLSSQGLVDDFLVPEGQATIGNSDFLERVTSQMFGQGGSGRLGRPIAEFRSPVREVAEEIEIPSKGLKGSEFLKHLRSNPTVRNSEINAMDMQIDPMSRYSREELIDLVNENDFTVAALGAGPRYSTMQRQSVLDPQIDYEEIMINATREGGKPMFRPKHGRTHYDDNTVGHARVSIRQPDPDGPSSPDNRPYILVEEMQSDLLQAGYEPARRGGHTSWQEAVESQLRFHENPWGNSEIAPAIRNLIDVQNPDEIFKDTFDQLRRGMSINNMDATEVRNYLRAQGVRDSDLTQTTNPFKDFSEAFGRPAGRKFAAQIEETLTNVYNESLFKVDNQNQLGLIRQRSETINQFSQFIRENYGVKLSDWDSSQGNLFTWVVNKANSRPSDLEHNFIEDLQSILFEQAKRKSAIGSPPVTSTTESTRAIVQSILAYADHNNINQIVFPPLERIAAERFTPGTKDYTKAITPGSGFHQTYVTSLNKVLKELEKELGRNIQINRETPINYERSQYGSGGRPEVTETQATRDLGEIRWYLNRQERHNWSSEELYREMGGDLIRRLDTRYGYDWVTAESVQELLEINQSATVSDLPSTGISVHIITGQLDMDLTRPRFKDGGLVTQTKEAFKL